MAKTVQDWEQAQDGFYRKFADCTEYTEVDPKQVRRYIERMPADTWTINGMVWGHDLRGRGPNITCLTKEKAIALLEGDMQYTLEAMSDAKFNFRAKTAVRNGAYRYIEVVRADSKNTVIDALTIEMPEPEPRTAKKKGLLSRLFG